MAGIGHRGFMGRKKGGGGTPIPPSAVGIDTNSHSYFIDVDGFDNLAGSDDYTFIGWYNWTSGGEIVFLWQGDFGSNRLEITNHSLIYSATRYGEISPSITTLPAAIVVVKSAGLTDVYHYREGVRTDFTGLSVPDSLPPSGITIGNSLTINASPNGEIIAMQYWNSALSIPEINNLLTNYELAETADQSLSFFQNTSGSSDNGAYPALMTSNIVPSAYVVSASFYNTGEFPWRAFDGDFNTRTILRNAAGTASAGAWLKIDLGSSNEQAIDKYLFRSWASQGLNSFTVAGSNDDSTYTDLFTGNGVNNANIIQSFTWTNSTTYRYYRITCNSGFNATQWTHYQSVLIDQSKEWQSGAGFAKDGTMIFPT